jgi:hypothetical protein
MSAEETETTLLLARKLLNHLSEPLRSELKVLLDKDVQDPETLIAMVDLLSQNENIRHWIREQIVVQHGDSSSTRNYSPLAGRLTSITASQKWICPRRRCKNSLPVIQESEEPPICDEHKVRMTRAMQKKE